MQATDPNFNPAYSTIKAIYLSDESQSDPLNIIRQNSECVFERIEFVENANDVFPNGVLIVRDTKDIVSRIKEFQISKVIIEFFDSKKWNLDVTSVTYLNNAASETEENFVGIYFTNKYYKLSQTKSLNVSLGLGAKKPNVLRIYDMVDTIKRDYFDLPITSTNLYGDADETTNYVLYRPLNTIRGREEMVSDNGIEYLSYLSSCAIDKKNNNPSFLFWTNFDETVNFKAFHYDLTNDPTYTTLDTDLRRFAIYNGEAVLQKLSDNKIYRKIYFYNTDPAYQYISKNYYYIRKTPKVLDEIPQGLCAEKGDALTSELDTYINKSLMYQFQDEGERYNIEVIGHSSIGITNSSPQGGDQLVYDKQWGYYDGLDSINYITPLTHLNQNFGTQSSYKNLNLMGTTGYMPYVDNTEMWKNVFDLTSIHPDFPDGGYAAGADTKLQKVIDARYATFLAGLCGAEKQLEQYRKIELQNFIGYVLCCMGKQDDCFFAVLQKYEVDNTKKFTGSNDYMYRYQWSKLEFQGPSGSTGTNDSSMSSSTGPTGSTYFHHIENWNLSNIRSSTFQDETWAINLNERGLSGGYLPPGWVGSCIPAGFNYRPIGAIGRGLTSENIFHIAKICRHSDGEKYFYYFIAENIVDGCCP